MKRFASPKAILAIAWSLFQLYASLREPPMHPLVAVPIHVSFGLALCFLLFPLVRPKPKLTENTEEPPENAVARWWDYALSLLSLLIGVYVLTQEPRLVSRIPGVDDVTGGDLAFGVTALLLLLEASRRIMGWGMTGVALFFLVYQFAGKIIPVSVLAHRGTPTLSFFKDVIDTQVLQAQGIFGTASQVSYDTVFYFILFGAFLEISGGGKLFLDFAVRVVGRFRGGPAKAAIVSSSLFGTISGSAVANVAVDGFFTIPLMKKAGFKGSEAAAVEAVASTGGQIMPPVMGAAAFLMAQFLNVPYSKVMLAAIIPAVVYYAALYFIVDLTAARDRIRGLTEAEIGVDWGSIGRRLYLAIPIVTVVYLVMSNKTLMTTGVMTSGIIVVILFVMRAVRLTRGDGSPGEHVTGFVGDVLSALESSAKQAVQVAVPCAAAGIVVGVVTMTGLGVKFTSIVVSASGGSLIVSLLLVMIAVIILGMGMPTTSAYLMGMVVAVPALVKLGVTALSAHMFVFYFACLSMVTPPVALAAYVASGIAGANMWESGWKAFRNALPGFLIAYAFVFSPSLLLEGSTFEIAFNSVTAVVGSLALAGSFSGYLMAPSMIWERALLFAAGVLLIVPDVVASLAGLAVLGAVAFVQYRRRSASVPVVAAVRSTTGA